MATAPLQPTEEFIELRTIRERYGFGEDVSDEKIFRASRTIHDGSRDLDMKVAQELAIYATTGRVPYHLTRCSQNDVLYDQAWIDSVRR